jgi:3-dehydroquinate dehydratase/shikimate dehydrogenase
MEPIRICETVTAATTAELRARRDAADRADLVELRLDGVVDPDVDAALAGRQRPVVVTCRPRWEGGRFDGSEEERLRLLARAVEGGAEFVDVEAGADWRRLPLRQGQGTGLILSFHDWQGVPADLAQRLRTRQQVGPAIVKVAVTATVIGDCLRLRQVATDAAQPTVVIAMGRRGQLTRVCPWLFGSCWTYAGQAAPGQVPTRTLVERYRVREGSRTTQVYGIAGDPLAHSASVAMHNAAFGALGIDAQYVAFESASMDEVTEVASAFGVHGLSVTAPLKRAARAAAAESDDLTRQLGAANTLRRTAKGWDARNFDVPGFLDPLDRRGIGLVDTDALVIGAGGAACAVIAALQDRGVRVHVAARRRETAEVVARQFDAAALAWPPAGRFDLVVNATPVGTWPDVDASPAPAGGLDARLVYDLVYNPIETRFQAEARAAGAGTIGGLEMLVHQAVLQFEWWTGCEAPVDVMRDAAEQFVTREVVESHETDDVR